MLNNSVKMHAKFFVYVHFYGEMIHSFCLIFSIVQYPEMITDNNGFGGYLASFPLWWLLFCNTLCSIINILGLCPAPWNEAPPTIVSFVILKNPC